MIERELSLKDYFEESFMNDIFSGVLKPGDKVESIRDLSNKHHVSRSVIANGLKDLFNAGFLRKDETNHYYVKGFKKYDRIETMLYYLNFNNAQLDLKEIKAIQEVKGALDFLAIDLIGPNLSEESFNKLMNILNLDLRDTPDFPHYAALEYYHFLREFYLLTDNFFLPLFLKSFLNVTINVVENYCEVTPKEELFKATKEALVALYNKDLKLAKEKIKERFILND